MNELDRKWMSRAIELARKGLGKTRPNPAVGCVIAREGSLLGEGYHRKAGENHAEIEALAQCGDRNLEGATCYVTMEPCNHQGRTAPCSDAIIRSGIKRVVVAQSDPNPGVQGGGIDQLRAAGIDVMIGILESEARLLNEAWIKWITTGRPFVVLKMGISLDGKVATCAGNSRWISGVESRKFAHGLRQELHGIMAGSGTVVSDDPALTARDGDQVVASPVRIIADSRMRSPLRSQIFEKGFPGRTILATVSDSDLDKQERLQEMGNEVIHVESSNQGLDLIHLMDILGGSGIESILLEGGPTLAFSMLKCDLVDKVMLFIAPIIIGGTDAPSAIGGAGFPELDSVPRLQNIQTRRLGDNILIEGYLPGID